MYVYVSIQTDLVIEYRRPDIVVVEQDNKTALLIDISVFGDTRVDNKEHENKVNKYRDMARELKRLSKVNTNVITIVVGALGTTPKSHEKTLKSAGTNVVKYLNNQSN